jgi:hypothetical protein
MHHSAIFVAAVAGLGLAMAGCQKTQPDARDVTRATSSALPEASVVELFDAQARFEPPDIVHFEVKYRFTQGGPNHFYCAEVTFPGTTNAGIKLISGWELQPSGVLRDGIVLQSGDVKEFEIRMTEAISPQDGYVPISNIIAGEVVPAEIAVSGT